MTSETAKAKKSSKIISNDPVFDFKAQLLLNNGVNIHTRTILFAEDVTMKAYTKLVKHMDLLKALGDDPIHIHLTTSGGCVYSMLAIMDYLLSSKVLIEIYAIGEVASAGIPIYACGDLRTSGRFTKFMIHPLSYTVPHGKLADHKAEMKLTNSMEKQTNQFLATRTRKNYRWWDEAGRKADLYIDAEDAKEIGLVHGIQTERANYVDPNDKQPK